MHCCILFIFYFYKDQMISSMNDRTIIISRTGNIFSMFKHVNSPTTFPFFVILFLLLDSPPPIYNFCICLIMMYLTGQQRDSAKMALEYILLSSETWANVNTQRIDYIYYTTIFSILYLKLTLR